MLRNVAKYRASTGQQHASDLLGACRGGCGAPGGSGDGPAQVSAELFSGRDRRRGAPRWAMDGGRCAGGGRSALVWPCGSGGGGGQGRVPALQDPPRGQPLPLVAAFGWGRVLHHRDAVSRGGGQAGAVLGVVGDRLQALWPIAYIIA